MRTTVAFVSNRYNRVQMNAVSFKIVSVNCITFRTAVDSVCGSGSDVFKELFK